MLTPWLPLLAPQGPAPLDPTHTDTWYWSLPASSSQSEASMAWHQPMRGQKSGDAFIMWAELTNQRPEWWRNNQSEASNLNVNIRQTEDMSSPQYKHGHTDNWYHIKAVQHFIVSESLSGINILIIDHFNEESSNTMSVQWQKCAGSFNQSLTQYSESGRTWVGVIGFC